MARHIYTHFRFFILFFALFLPYCQPSKEQKLRESAKSFIYLLENRKHIEKSIEEINQERRLEAEKSQPKTEFTPAHIPDWNYQVFIVTNSFIDECESVGNLNLASYTKALSVNDRYLNFDSRYLPNGYDCKLSVWANDQKPRYYTQREKQACDNSALKKQRLWQEVISAYKKVAEDLLTPKP